MSFSSKENKGSIFTFTIKLESIENGIKRNVEKNEDIFQLNSKNFQFEWKPNQSAKGTNNKI